jgi:hypothetical protein
MARATYSEIGMNIVTKNEGLPKDKKFIVCPPGEPDEAMTVYPPTSYHDDHGVDVFLKGNTAEMFIDGYKVLKLDSIQDVDVVAGEIIKVLETVQAERAKEFEE